jgi:hypothetical protein
MELRRVCRLLPAAARCPSGGLTSVEGKRGFGNASPSGSRVMADAPISDQEIAILCDVLEGWGANLNADKRKVLDQLIAKGVVVLSDQEFPAKYKLTGKAQ